MARKEKPIFVGNVKCYTEFKSGISLLESIKEAIVNGTATDFTPTVIPDNVEPVEYLMDKATKEFKL
jgi:hypothetical protein